MKPISPSQPVMVSLLDTSREAAAREGGRNWFRWAKPLRRFLVPGLLAVALHAVAIFWPSDRAQRAPGPVGADAGASRIQISSDQFSSQSYEMTAPSAPSAGQASSPTDSLPEPLVTSVSPDVFLMPIEFDMPKVKVDSIDSSSLVAEHIASGRAGMKSALAGSGFANSLGTGTARSLRDGRSMALSMPAPVYPESARRDGREGHVEIYVAISATGHPAKVEVMVTSGSRDLDAAAKKVVSERWRFQPPTDAESRECHVRIAFQLESHERFAGKLD